MSNPLVLTIDQESILERNLVWIFGSPRSGTTWLARKLLSHNTHTMDEPLIGHILPIVTGDINAEVKMYVKQKSREDYFFSDKYIDLWEYHLRKLILNRIYGQFHTLSKKIILKEPNGALGSKIISECLPNSKIIILLRDGRDVVDSLLDARSEGSWRAAEEGTVVTSEKRISFLKKAAKNWEVRMKVVMKTYETHNVDLKYILRYEDLRQKTSVELEKIYKFLDIEISRGQLEKIVTNSSFENIPSDKKGKGKSRRSATPGGWKNNFSENEKKIIEEIMKERLMQLGYEI